MIDRSGRQLERLVAAIEAMETKGAQVTWDDDIDGRQFDVTLRFKFGLHCYLTVIECKQHNSKVSVDKVDALVTKARDARANKVIMVSTKGFQTGCHAVAERHGVQLLVVTEKSEIAPEVLAEKLSPAIRVFEVRFVKPDGKEVLLEDWGGRLTYLMKQSKVYTAGEVHSPDELTARWEQSLPSMSSDGETAVELPLDPGARLEEPYDDPVDVIAMRFKYKFTEVRFTSGPVVDAHLQDSFSRQVQVHDETGRLVHQTALASIPIGFDTTLVPGEFYEVPSLFIRYYCEKIEGESVTWVVIENYQFGLLLQARMTQSMKHRTDYVPVVDKRVRKRLERLLERYKSRPREV